ncbi:MAG: hypothetical protein JSS50_00620 [Proteobacteria bacterium]|nr:hypothetical protein [Pseudomonadota bacterium]
MSINSVTYNNALTAYAKHQAAAKASKIQQLNAITGQGNTGKMEAQQPELNQQANWQPAILRRDDDLQIIKTTAAPASATVASFSGVVGVVAQQIDKVRQGEGAAKKAISGDINKVDLIELVNEAETALKLAQALCGKMVISFKEVLQTPL